MMVNVVKICFTKRKRDKLIISALVEYLLRFWRVIHCILLQKIPTKFVKHMEGRTSGSVSLEGPSGNTWLVDLVRHNDDLYIHRGWPGFVSDHYIECGDFLIFRYNGNLHFTVQVFDQSACEKEAAFHSACNLGIPAPNLGQKRDRQGGASSSDRIVEGVLKKMRESPSQIYSERGHCGDSVIAPLPKSYVLPGQAENCNGKPGNRAKFLLGFFRSYDYNFTVDFRSFLEVLTCCECCGLRVRFSVCTCSCEAQVSEFSKFISWGQMCFLCFRFDMVC